MNKVDVIKVKVKYILREILRNQSFHRHWYPILRIASPHPRQMTLMNSKCRSLTGKKLVVNMWHWPQNTNTSDMFCLLAEDWESKRDMSGTKIAYCIRSTCTHVTWLSHVKMYLFITVALETICTLWRLIWRNEDSGLALWAAEF